MSQTVSAVCWCCDARIKAPAAAAGRTASCPRCKAAVKVPSPGSQPSIDTGAHPAGSESSPLDLPEDLPLPRRAHPTKPANGATPEPRPLPKGVWVLIGLGAGAGGMGVVAALALVLAWSRRDDGPTTEAPAASAKAVAPSPTPPAMTKAEQARESMDVVANKARKGLNALTPMALPPHQVVDRDSKGSLTMLISGTLAPDASVPVRFDVTETASVINPYRGVVTFGMKVDARLKGSSNGQTQSRDSFFPSDISLPFSLKLDMRAKGEAEFTYTDGRWQYDRVRYAPTSAYASSEEPIEQNLFAAGLANETNRRKLWQNDRLIPLNEVELEDLRRVFRNAAGQ